MRRLSYANGVATLAVFVALAGSAAAAVIVSSNSEIAPNTIYGANLPAGKNDNIVGGSIGTSDLANNAVSGPKLATSAVATGKLADTAVTGPKLATGAVVSGKLADKAVIAGKLGDGAVALSNLANGAVGTPKLANASVTVPKLGQDVLDRIDSHTGTARQFTGTVPVGASTTVKTVAGVEIFVSCHSITSAEVGIEFASGLQVSGTGSSDSTVAPVNGNNGGGRSFEGFESDLDVIARILSVGTFARIDVHAEASGNTGNTSCLYWGVTQIAQ
jgi:hypothetical protein